MRKISLLILSMLFGISIIFSTSLWNTAAQNTKFRSLYSDNKAYSIGDILTILVVESVSLSQSDRTQNRQGGIISTTASIIKNISNIDLSKFIPISGGESASNQMTSSIDNTAKSQVTGKIAAIIMEVDKNGNLFIEGRKEVKVGQDRREMILQGFIRPTDISADNTIDSAKIANAKLWYNGDVVFQQDPKEQNWINYILSGLAGVIF